MIYEYYWINIGINDTLDYIQMVKAALMMMIIWGYDGFVLVDHG